MFSNVKKFPADCLHYCIVTVSSTEKRVAIGLFSRHSNDEPEFPAYGKIYSRNYNDFIVTTDIHQGL